MLGYCKIPLCKKPVENRDSGLCASHSKALRKVVQSPIKKASIKLSKKLLTYSERAKEFIKNKRCAVYPQLKAEEVHHKRGRTGDLLLDEAHWLPVSRKGHVKIEMNPRWAKEMGYSESRLKWDKEPAPLTIDNITKTI